MDGMKRSLSVTGDFKSVDQLQNIVLKSMTGATLYLKDVAEVKDAFAEKESYARLDHKNVITLNVVKRSGENLIDASDKIRVIIAVQLARHFLRLLRQLPSKFAATEWTESGHIEAES